MSPARRPMVGAIIAVVALVSVRLVSHGRAWSPQLTPDLGAPGGEFVAVAATSPTNAWAVGSYGKGTLIEHWNGSSWEVQPTPNVGALGSWLVAVAATSSSNAWSVGSQGSTGIGTRTLIEHWNGRAWTVQRSPDVGTFGDQLDNVAATSSTNAWAVGHYSNGSELRTLIEHWDGSAWTVQPSPNLVKLPGRTFNSLFAVAATSSTSAWAVGYYDDHAVRRALIEHWDGSAWSVQRAPDVGLGDQLQGVAATSPTDAWAVGSYSSVDSGGTLILHWNGFAWVVTSSPNFGRGNSQLVAVAATSPTNAWAVGKHAHGYPDRILIEHWNGAAWTIEPSPDPGSGNNELTGVAATSATSAWAVGSYSNRAETFVKTLAIHCC